MLKIKKVLRKTTLLSVALSLIASVCSFNVSANGASNLAQGKTVTAPGWINPNYLVDGNITTASYTTTAPAVGAPITVDIALGDTAVDFNRVVFYENGTGTTTRISGFTIQYWDGEAFVDCPDQVKSVTRYTNNIKFSTVSATQVRLNITAGTAPNVYEIMVFNLMDENAAKFNVGDYIQMGYYDGAFMKWRVVDVSPTEGPLLISDIILTYKQFDRYGTNTANGSSHGREVNTNASSSANKIRAGYGSNYWPDSNLRSWLNSNATTTGGIEWLCGNPPSLEPSTTGPFKPGSTTVRFETNYYGEKGFLNNFSPAERNAIKAVTQKTSISSVDATATASAKLGTSEVFGSANMVSTATNTSFTNTNNFNSSYPGYYQNVTDKVFIFDTAQLMNLYNISKTDNKGILESSYFLPKLSNGTTASTYTTIRGGNAHPTNNAQGSSVRVTTGSTSSVSQADAYNNSSLCGVRPAFYLDEGIVKVTSGDGSSANPYIIEGNGAWGFNDFTVAGNTATVKLAKKADESGQVILACYNSDSKIVSVLTKDATVSATSETINFTNIPAETTKFKLFIWNDFVNLKPLGEMVGK